MRNEKIMLKEKKEAQRLVTLWHTTTTLLPLPHIYYHSTTKTGWWMLQNGFDVIASNWSQLGEETIMRSVGGKWGLLSTKISTYNKHCGQWRRAEINNISRPARLHNTSTTVVALLPHCCTAIFPPFWLHIARLCHCSPVSFHYMTVEPPLPLRCWRCRRHHGSAGNLHVGILLSTTYQRERVKIAAAWFGSQCVHWLQAGSFLFVRLFVFCLE